MGVFNSVVFHALSNANPENTKLRGLASESNKRPTDPFYNEYNSQPEEVGSSSSVGVSTGSVQRGRSNKTKTILSPRGETSSKQVNIREAK